MSARSLVVLVVGISLALAARLSLWRWESSDYTDYTLVWYSKLRSEGFGALADDFSDYTPPYLYALLVLARVLPDLSSLAATKVPGSVGDLLCAGFAFLLVRHVRSEGRAVAASLAVLLAPTVVVNSAVWGQSDSLFTAGLLAAVYATVRGATAWAWVAFALAFAVKLQSTFLLPFLLARTPREKWPALSAVPVVYALAILPCLVAGRPLGDLLSIYVEQADQLQALSLDAPNLYAWVPATAAEWAFPVGLGLGALASVGVWWRARGPAEPERTIALALLSLLLVPFVLPRMHERYFFPADVLSIVLAVLRPRLVPVAVLVSVASLLAYAPFLLQRSIVPMGVLAIAMSVALVWLVSDLRRSEVGSATP
jgi:Gpi18-like mannosyltransferase